MLAVVVTAVVAVRAGLRARRTLTAFSRVVAAAGAETTRRVAGLDGRTRALDAGTARLDAAKARLQRSLAELSVLTEAAGEAAALARGVRGAVPRK